MVLFTSCTIFGQVINGLTAEYSFNGGNANDGIAGNNGIVHGATLTTDRFGNSNFAYLFSGNDYIALPHSTALKNSTSSVSLWARLDGEKPDGTNTNWIYTVPNSYSGAYFCSFGIYTLNDMNLYGGWSQNVGGS